MELETRLKLAERGWTALSTNVWTSPKGYTCLVQQDRVVMIDPIGRRRERVYA